MTCQLTASAIRANAFAILSNGNQDKLRGQRVNCSGKKETFVTAKSQIAQNSN
jgi:hypothetical protein